MAIPELHYGGGMYTLEDGRNVLADIFDGTDVYIYHNHAASFCKVYSTRQEAIDALLEAYNGVGLQGMTFG